MSFSKVKIYNLALSALLLAQEVIEISTDKSNAVGVLNTFWEPALEATLQDLDLDGLSQPISLELLATLTDEPWQYVYKYPTNCAFLRRIISLQITDNRSTHISKRVALYEGSKAIYTDEYQAVGECIPKDAPLEAFSAMAGIALAYKLAFLASPLIVGKGAKTLRKEILALYLLAKSDAQETDSLENFNYESDSQRSEFVEERLS